jgi:glucokinase
VEVGRLAVGVDVGGTKVAAALLDETGAVVRRSRAETESTEYHALVDGIVAAVSEVASDHTVGAVGLAIAGNVAADGSHVLFSPHLPLAGEPLAADLTQRLGLPVLVDNDANAAAWAEHACGAGRDSTDMLFVALGTGLGAGLVLGGELYRGHHGFAGEAGHITVVVDGRSCPCGSRGCWERYASGTALVAQYLEHGGDPEVGGPGITRRATAGDATALAAMTEVGEWLGRGLASLVAVLDPAVIVVGGGVSEAGDLLLDPARRLMRASVTGAERRPLPPILAASLGNEAGVVGAALLAARHAS